MNSFPLCEGAWRLRIAQLKKVNKSIEKKAHICIKKVNECMKKVKSIQKVKSIKKNNKCIKQGKV